MTIRRQTWIYWLFIILAGLLFAMLCWRLVTGWTPSRDQYPVQGVAIGYQNGPVEWNVAKAKGVDFVYLSATYGANRRDPAFASNLEGAKQAGLRVGAIHHYNLCRLASDQATEFITTVPRSDQSLPTVVALEFSPDCHDRPGRELVLSEISTFLNQVETHSGKPAILRISAEFEKLYGLSSAVNRTFWLEGDFFPPDYAAKPWVMWTASNLHRMQGIDGDVDWVVVRP